MLGACSGREKTQVNLFQPVQLGLTSTQRLYQALGRPMDDVPIVHIAGTNGKVGQCGVVNGSRIPFLVL